MSAEMHTVRTAEIGKTGRMNEMKDSACSTLITTTEVTLNEALNPSCFSAAV